MSTTSRPAADTLVPTADTDSPVAYTVPLMLAAIPTAVGAARRYVRNELMRRGYVALVGDAELVSSELVTNAVLATGLAIPDPTWPELDGVTVIRIRLGFSATFVLIEVWDSQATLPTQQEPGTEAEGGRGLFIVAAMCTRWDVRPVAGGKVVWAELPLPAPEELPRRMPKRRTSPGPRGTSGSPPAGYRDEREVMTMRKNGGGGG